MEKIASNFNYSAIEKLLYTLDEDHSSTTLSKLKNEINRLFYKTKCKEILYTLNTDKLFFGMRVYPNFDGGKAMEIMGDHRSQIFDSYYLEFDSKLFDPLLGLDPRELTAILLHEIGHIVYDTQTIDEVRKQLDIYFTKTGEHVNLSASKGYRELIGYALKDSVFKVGSLFSKIGNDEIIADTFVVACGYGPDLESAIRKIRTSATYLNKEVDDRLITLAWVLRLNNGFAIRRVPAIKTLNKAKALTASQLEKREITYATNIVAKMDEPVSEGALDNIKSRFSKKFTEFKSKGIRAIKNDIYELNLRLRTATDADELMMIIRTVNSDVAILQDYMTEDISDVERQECFNTLQELYDIRQKASKEHKVVDRRGSSFIQIYYPDME